MLNLKYDTVYSFFKTTRNEQKYKDNKITLN